MCECMVATSRKYRDALLMRLQTLRESVKASTRIGIGITVRRRTMDSTHSLEEARAQHWEI